MQRIFNVYNRAIFISKARYFRLIKEFPLFSPFFSVSKALKNSKSNFKGFCVTGTVHLFLSVYLSNKSGDIFCRFAGSCLEQLSFSFPEIDAQSLFQYRIVDKFPYPS